VSTAYTPNNLNQYTAIGTQTSGGTSCSGASQGLSYDCNGNLTGDGTFSYGYDAENRLLTASKTGLAAAYQYDPLGRRTRKSGTGVVGTFYLSDGADEIAEYDGTSGALTERYIPGPAIDEPVAMVDGTTGAKEYFHANHQGSIIAMTGDNGLRVEGPFKYDPYGNCFAGSNPCSTGEPYRFTGRRLDPETGLYYYRARYYDPAKGRFLQTDPVGYTADLNLYTYVGNDPTDKTDPTGLVAGVDDAAEIALIGLTAGTVAWTCEQSGACPQTAKWIWSKIDQVRGKGQSPAKPKAQAKPSNKKTPQNRKNDPSDPRRGPPPNDGNAAPHGGPDHQEAMRQEIENARSQGAENIRANQTQVDLHGNSVGNNRPDVQYDLNGDHYNVEFDKNATRSAEHGETIRQNDPDSVCITNMICGKSPK